MYTRNCVGTLVRSIDSIDLNMNLKANDPGHIINKLYLLLYTLSEASSGVNWADSILCPRLGAE